MTANGSPYKSHRQWVLAALKQFEGRLTRYAARMLGDEESARDAVQHTFLRLCDEQAEELHDRLAAWLFAVCRNKVLDMLRRNGRDRSRLEDVAEDPPGREPDPADLLEEEDVHAGLRRLVDALPARQREVIDLWLEGFNYQQIGEITDRTEGSARVTVHRVLHRLRRHPWTRRLFDEDHPSHDEPLSVSGSFSKTTPLCENRDD